MATRSTIAIEFADGTVQQIYCHWDGYLDNNGKQLLEHYMDPFEVRSLIDLGDIRSLYPTVLMTLPQVFIDQQDCAAREYRDIEHYFEECQTEEYDYILRRTPAGQPKWYVRFGLGDPIHTNWVSLEEAVKQEEAENA